MCQDLCQALNMAAAKLVAMDTFWDFPLECPFPRLGNNLILNPSKAPSLYDS